MRHPASTAAALLAALAAGCGAGSPKTWVATARKAPLSAAAGEEVVTATGTAPGSGAEALWQAGTIARRHAVTEVLDRVVPRDADDPLTLVVRKRILDRWGDYLRPGARTVSKTAADGATTVTLQAVVVSESIRSDAARLRGEVDLSRKPRLLVVMCPAFEDGPSAPAGEAERAVAEVFASRGFRMVRNVRPDVRSSLVSAIRSEDPKALAALARSVGAEVALVGVAGRTGERVAEVFGREVSVYTPVVSLKAIDTGSAGTIFSREHRGEESVGDAALANATNDLAERCLAEMLTDRNRTAPAFATAAVRIDGVSFEEFAAFVRLAQTIPGVALVRAEPFAGESGRAEIGHALDPVDLARELVRLEGLSLRLVSSGAREIRIESARPAE